MVPCAGQSSDAEACFDLLNSLPQPCYMAGLSAIPQFPSGMPLRASLSTLERAFSSFPLRGVSWHNRSPALTVGPLDIWQKETGPGV